MIASLGFTCTRVAACLTIVTASLALSTLAPASAVAQAPSYSSIIVRTHQPSLPKEMLERLATGARIPPSAMHVRRVISAKAGALLTAHRLDRYHVITIPSGATDAALAVLRRDPGVELAIANGRYRLDGTASDPRAIEQWALRRIEAEGAWRLTRGADSIVIGFVDTGIDYEHPDLAASLWVNHPEDLNANQRLDAWPVTERRDGVSGDLDGVDQDGNGYVDDVIGYDFVDQTVPNVGDWGTRDGDPYDEQGHGTAIAGVIAAVHGNALGIAGLAPESPLVALRAFDATGNAEDDDIASAIVYAADNGVRVLNLSFGDVFYSPLMHDAIRYAHARGVVVVASAGNEGSDAPHYPSSYPEVISVAMTDSNDFRNDLSNFGSQVSVSAPGVQVLTTMRDSAYGLAGGTSIAAPHVSSIAALVLARHPQWSPDEVRGIIELTADDSRRPFGWDPFYGAGRVNARRAVEMEGPVLLAIHSPDAETGIGSDTTIDVIGSVHSPFIADWRLDVGLGEMPDSTSWRPITTGSVEGRIFESLGRLATAGLRDTVVTLRLVLRQTNGRSAERRARILIDRTAPRIVAHDVFEAWRFDERALGITVSTDDRTRLTAMLRPSGASEPFRAVSLEPERTGLVRTHYLVLAATELARGIEHDLYLVVANAAGDTAMIGSASAPLTVRRGEEAFPLRGFASKGYGLPYGFMLNETVAIIDSSDRTLALNRFAGGSFGDLVIYRFIGDRFVAIDSLDNQWLPKDFGDTDGDGLRELLVQSGSATRIYEQRSIGSSVLGNVIFDDATTNDATLARTLGAELVDLDGDGRDELIGRTDPRVLLVVAGDTLPPHYFIARNDGGAFTVVARLENPTRPGYGGAFNQYGSPNAAVADFNGDGRVEILIGDDDADFVLYARDAADNWRAVWSEENEGKGATELITRGDIDGDGRPEALTGFRGELTLRNPAGDYEPPFWTLRLRRFDGPEFTATSVWSDRVAYVRQTDPFRVGASLGDLDAAPGDELAVSIFPGMYVLRWDAARQVMEPLWWRYGSVGNQPMIADFDRDGVNELGVGDGATIAFHQIDRQSRGPDVPGGLVAWSTSDSTAYVEWSPVDSADSYNVYRAIVTSDTLPLRFSLIMETSQTSAIDGGETMPAGRLRAGDRIAYTVRAVRTGDTPEQGDFAAPVVVVVHETARLAAASAPTDSSIALALTQPVREALYRSGAFAVRRVVDGTSVQVSSVTFAGDRAVVLHLADVVSNDSLAVRLTRLFRDAFDAPGDTISEVMVRMPIAEAPGDRFIATRAELAGRDGQQRVVVYFNAPVEPETAGDVANYTIMPAQQEFDDVGTFASATVDPTDPTRVILIVRPSYPIGALGRNYVITIRDVRSSDGRKINGGRESHVGLTIEERDLLSLRVYPHPFSISRDGEVMFAGLTRDATVVILAPSGAVVRTLREVEHNGGVTWDGRDEAGSTVASGVYLYRVTARIDGQDVESELRKIAVVQ